MQNNSRTQNAILNVFFGYSSQFVSLLLSFISRTIFLQVLSVDYLGINGLFTDILQMLSLADLGFNTAMTYSFYKPIAQDDKEKIVQLVNFYKDIYIIIAVLVMAVGIALLPFLKYIVNLDEEIPLLNIYYLFSLFGVVSSYLCVYKTALLTATQKNYIIVRITIVINIMKTIIQCIVLLIFRNYIIYLTVALGCTCLNNVVASKKAEREYPYIKEKGKKLNKREKANIFSNLKSIFIYKISGILLNATDNTFISVLVNTVAVGYYSNYLMINNKLSGFLSVIFNSFTAGIGNVIITEKEDKRYSIFQALQYASFIVCGIMISSYLLLINDLIFVWLGEDFIFDKLTTLAVALNLYFSCVLQPLWSYREATGLYKKTRYVMVITALLNVVLSFLWGRRYGVKGILFASIVSRVLTYIWYEPYLLFKEYFKRPVLKYYFSILTNIFLTIVIVNGMSVLLQKFIVDCWGTLLLKALIVGVASISFYILCYFRTEGFKIVLDKIKLIVKTKF